MGIDFKDFYHARFHGESRTFLDCPTFRGFPLGGIGNGGISIYADGDLSECRTNHSWNIPVRDLRGSFFAIRTKEAGGRVQAKLLRRTHHHSKEYSVDNIAHTSFRGEIPWFNLTFQDDDLPVEVALSGFSPLIPHNVKDSSLPAVLFEVEIRNPTDQDLEVSVLFSWQNVLGITGTSCHAMYRKHAFRSNHSRHNFAEEASEGLLGVKFGIQKDFPPTDPRRRGIGNTLILTEEREGTDVSVCTAWDHRADVPGIWEDFARDGRIRNLPGQGPGLPARKIKGKSGAVCVHRQALKAGETVKVPFHLCWFMPYYVIEKGALKKFITGKHDGTDHGTYAGNSFGSVEEMARYLLEEKGRLRAESLELPGILKDPEVSNLPPWLADVILNAADSMLTNSVLTRKGDFFMIEGMGWTLAPFSCGTHFSHQTWIFGALTGTMDQRLCGHVYSSVFFPELDKSELVTFRDLAEEGKVPHGNGGAEIALKDTDTPYARPIPWVNDGESDWTDLNCSLILQLGKLIRMTGDRPLLLESWDALMEMRTYLLSLVEDHVPEACSTYDVFVYKPCFLYAATLFAATNLMLADLARHVPAEKDPEASRKAQEFLEQAEATCRTIEEKLWNEEKGFYRVCESRDTIFQGGLAGDWIARLAGLQPVLPLERARSHSRWQSRVLVDAAKGGELVSGPFAGRPLPYNEATPEGKRVDLKLLKRFKLRINYIYQVVSHQALEAIYLGRVEEGLDCIRMIYEKAYEEGYPWDMSLFGMPGFVYMTHPVMWGLFYAMTGAAVDLLARTIRLAPKTFPGSDTLRLPVFFPLFWLAVEYTRSTGQGSVRVLKVVGNSNSSGKGSAQSGNEAVKLEKLILTREDGTTREQDLNGFVVEEGAAFTFSM